MNEVKIVIEELDKLTDAVNALALTLDRNIEIKSPANMPALRAPVPAAPAVTPQALIQQAPVQQPAAPVPVQQAAVAPAPVQQTAPPAQVPVTAAPQEYTIEQLQVAAAGLTQAGKMPQVMAILQGFGIQAMTELKKEQYGAFAAALREAGGQI